MEGFLLYIDIIPSYIIRLYSKCLSCNEYVSATPFHKKTNVISVSFQLYSNGNVIVQTLLRVKISNLILRITEQSAILVQTTVEISNVYYVLLI